MSLKATLGDRSENELVSIHFQDIWVEFQSLDKAARDKITADLPPRLQAAVEGTGTANQDLKVEWSDLPVLRIRVLAETPEALLRSRASEIRAELLGLVGDEAFKRLRPNGVVDERTADVQVLRADLIQMVELIGQACSHSLSNEGFRKGIAAWLIKRVPPALVVSGMLSLSLLAWNQGGWKWLSDRTEFLGTAIAVAIFGVLGAFVSANRRMAPPPIEAASFGAWFALRQFYNATKFALVLGGIFAIVWWLLMLGGVVKGTVFPQFQPGRAIPDGMPSWALLAIWSFLAGFAERLVLDTLDKLANTGAPVQFAQPQGPTPPQPGAPPAAKTQDAAEADVEPEATTPGNAREEDAATTGDGADAKPNEDAQPAPGTPRP